MAGFKCDDVLIDTTNELHETIYGMISDDYKARFKAEYKQVKIRRERLKKVIREDKEGKLKFDTPLNMLELQCHYMKCYLEVLEERAAIEGINLD